jgi:hypothetical protein
MGDPPEIIEDDLKQGNDTARNRHYGKRREKFVKSLFLHLTLFFMLLRCFSQRPNSSASKKAPLYSKLV